MPTHLYASPLAIAVAGRLEGQFTVAATQKGNPGEGRSRRGSGRAAAYGGSYPPALITKQQAMTGGSRLAEGVRVTSAHVVRAGIRL
jgi:hypothetical protein